jgi:thioredoxin-like negative regulator of GroEL
MAPIVHGLEAEYSGQIKFVYLDIDDPANTDFERQLGFRVQPQFFLLDENGEIIQQWLGRVSADDFKAAFEAAQD